MQVHESQISNYPKQIVGKSLMLNNCSTATKCVHLVSNLWLLSVCLIMIHFLKSSVHIVGKLLMHPCVSFCSGALLAFLVHPRVHRAHRLKSTDLVIRLVISILQPGT